MTPQDPRNPDRDPTDAWPQGDALDRSLQAGLRPPVLPPGFRAALRRAIELEAEHDLLARRRAAEADHAQRLAELRAGYISVRRNTLAIVLAVAFTAGAGATVALPLLALAIGTDVATLAPLLAVTIGLGIGVPVLLERFGLARRG